MRLVRDLGLVKNILLKLLPNAGDITLHPSHSRSQPMLHLSHFLDLLHAASVIRDKLRGFFPDSKTALNSDCTAQPTSTLKKEYNTQKSYPDR